MSVYPLDNQVPDPPETEHLKSRADYEGATLRDHLGLKRVPRTQR